MDDKSLETELEDEKESFQSQSDGKYNKSNILKSLILTLKSRRQATMNIFTKGCNIYHSN